MDHDTLVIVPDAPSVAPLVDLLHLLHHQRLVRPFYVWVAGDAGFRSIADDPHSTTASRYDLVDFVRGDFDDFCVAHVHLADAASVDASHACAEQAERTVRDSLSMRDERFRQRLHLVNLVAPVAEPGRIPRGVSLAGVAGTWANLVVMPEVQERSDLAVVPVRSDEEYIAHVACNVASIVGLWVGSSLDDTAPLLPDVGRTTSLDHWHLVRTRERLISAPELPDMVVGGVTTTILTAARRGELRLEMVAERDVDRLLRLILDRFVAEHDLTAMEPLGAGGGHQRIVGIRQFFTIIGLFLRTIPGRVLDEVVAVFRGIRRWWLRRLDRFVGTEDLAFRFSDEDRAHQAEPHRIRSERPIRTAAIDAYPELWSGLRRLAFGLLDGSEPDDRYRDLLERGQQRLIIPDPRWAVDPNPLSIGLETSSEVVTGPSADQSPLGGPPPADEPSNDEEPSEPPSDGVADPAADPVTPDEPSPGVGVEPAGPRAFVDLVLRRIEEEHARAASMTGQLRSHYAARRREIEGSASGTNGRSRIRRVVRVLWRIVRPLLWIAAFVAVAVYLPGLLPFSGVIAIGVIVITYALMALTLIRRFLRYLARWFRDENLRKSGVPELVDLEQRIDAAEDQQERFRQLLAVAPEWREVIRSIIYEPFGPPVATDTSRIRELDLFLPDSHKVEEGVASTIRESGIIEVIRERIFSAGWLQTQYAGAVDYVTREQQIAQPGLPFIPDNDTTLPGAKQQGDRSRLLESLSSGRAVRDSRLRLIHQVHHHLLTGESLPLGAVPLVDWLFSELSGGSKPYGFLSEVDSAQPSGWNRGQILQRMGSTGAVELVERVAGGMVVASTLPDLPDAEAMLEGATVTYDPLLFRARSIEMSVNVPEGELLAFSDEATPAEIDLSRTVDLWVIPPPLDEGEVELFTTEERDRWGLDDSVLPPLHDLIVPSGVVVPARGQGPYTFMREAFGRPVPIRRRRIPYVVRTTAAPPNADEIVHRVLQHTADTTGLEFEFIGHREDLPWADRDIDYLYLAWAFDDEYRRYEISHGFTPGSSIGLGGPIVLGSGDGRIEVVGGTAVLNSEMTCTHELDMWPNHALILLHEVGHALNLGHVSSKNEVMAQGIWEHGLSAWGNGDRRGLQLVVAEAMRIGVDAA